MSKSSIKNKLIKILKQEEDIHDFDFYHKEGLEKDGLKITQQENFGGEGEGDDYWVVFKVESEDEVSYWKVPGWYASYAGGELELERIFEVRPVEKTITVWE